VLKIADCFRRRGRSIQSPLRSAPVDCRAAGVDRGRCSVSHGPARVARPPCASASINRSRSSRRKSRRPLAQQFPSFSASTGAASSTASRGVPPPACSASSKFALLQTRPNPTSPPRQDDAASAALAHDHAKVRATQSVSPGLPPGGSLSQRLPLLAAHADPRAEPGAVIASSLRPPIRRGYHHVIAI